MAKDLDASLKTAEQLLTLRKYAEASKLLSTAIAAQPNDPQVTLLKIKIRYADAMVRGDAAVSAKNYPAAVTAYGEAINEVPTSLPAPAGASEKLKSRSPAPNVANDFDAKVQKR